MVAITKTRTQLIAETADKLNLVGTGQVLEQEYRTVIDDKIDPLIAQLAADEIVYVGDTNAIPAEWFDCLAGLLSNLCAPLGGKNYDPQVKAFYEMGLRRTASAGPAYQPLQADYY